jgi:hypothetical protein
MERFHDGGCDTVVSEGSGDVKRISAQAKLVARFDRSDVNAETERRRVELGVGELLEVAGGRDLVIWTPHYY